MAAKKKASAKKVRSSSAGKQSQTKRSNRKGEARVGADKWHGITRKKKATKK